MKGTIFSIFHTSFYMLFIIFQILIKANDPQRERKFEKFQQHKTQCQKMYDEGKRFKKTDVNGDEVYVSIGRFGLNGEIEFAKLQEQSR